MSRAGSSRPKVTADRPKRGRPWIEEAWLTIFHGDTAPLLYYVVEPGVPLIYLEKGPNSVQIDEAP